MATNIVLPTLTQWTENHLRSIIQAKNQADLNNAITSFLSNDAQIVVNGKTLTQQEFVQQIGTENFEEEGAVVQIVGSVEAPTVAGDRFTAGSVGILYNATIVEAIRIRDAPLSRQFTSTLNVVIEQDPSIPAPPSNPPFHGFFDGRRVMALNQVIAQGVADTSST